MAKMSTIKQLAIGAVPLKRGDEARIERNLFAENGNTFEALRFCKNRNGRHNRVHLVVREEEFVELFASAVEKKVFGERTLEALFEILRERVALSPEGPQAKHPVPFAELAGIFEDGTLGSGIDEALYGGLKE